MQDFLRILVKEDTPEAWSDLRRNMPWDLLSDAAETVTSLNPQQMDEIDVEDKDAVLDAIASNPEGTIWGEFEIEPGIELGEGFYPYIMSCQELVVLPKDATPGWDLTSLYRSDKPSLNLEASAVSFLVIACPRCQAIFTEGDEDAEFDLEHDWILQDCIACEGAGEWSYELL